MGDSVGDARDWVVKIQSEVDKYEILNERERDAHRRHAIYRVPNFFIRDEKRMQSYKPQVVSMGPYHHGEEQLLPMEEHKRRALRQFLVRTKKSIKEYCDALRGVVQELMDSYKDLDKHWKDDEEGFLELMVFDGCFMIELFRMEALRALGRLTPTGYEKNDPILSYCYDEDDFIFSYCYDENDPIFSYYGMLSNMPRIRRDMVMIENQIPLLVLKKLLSVERGVVDEDELWDLNQELNNKVLSFFAPEGLPYVYFELGRVELGLHALDVVRKSMIKDIEGRNRRRTKGSKDVIWPATQLQEAGIRFSKSRRPSLVDIHFRRESLHPTLSLPQLVVDDATESKFLNLIAFEHLHVRSRKEVTSYVCFMDGIIDSEKDVSLLSQKEIIRKHVGTDQAIADLFNGISQHASIDPATEFHVVYQAVTNHCRDPSNYHS